MDDNGPVRSFLERNPRDTYLLCLWFQLTGHLQTKELSEGSIKEPFTLMHGFYIVMGGIYFDMADDPERVWPRQMNRLMLRPTGIPFL